MHFLRPCVSSFPEIEGRGSNSPCLQVSGAYVLAELLSEVYGSWEPSSGAEGAGMSSGSRLPEACAGAKCLFVYLRKFWPYSHYAIAGGSLKCKDNDMFEKWLKRQLPSIETTSGSCSFMSTSLAVLITPAALCFTLAQVYRLPQSFGPAVHWGQGKMQKGKRAGRRCSGGVEGLTAWWFAFLHIVISSMPRWVGGCGKCTEGR